MAHVDMWSVVARRNDNDQKNEKQNFAAGGKFFDRFFLRTDQKSGTASFLKKTFLVWAGTDKL